MLAEAIQNFSNKFFVWAREGVDANISVDSL